MPRHSDVSRLRPGDIVTCRVTRAHEYQEIGLQVKESTSDNPKKYFICHVSGLCENIPVQVGDELLQLNDVHVRDYDDLEHIQQILEDEKTIALVLRRANPEEEEEEIAAVAAATTSSSRSIGTAASRRRIATSSGNTKISSRPKVVTSTKKNSDRYLLQEESPTSSGSDEDDEDDEYDHFDYERPELLRKESYDGSSVASELFRPGSAALLDNMHDTQRAKLQHQTVFIMHSSSKHPGNFECELEDGSRIEVSERNLKPISEEEESSFHPYVPGSNRSFAANLIEPGDLMKIRGLKKQAKMNGTLVEILRPAQEHSGRWECVVCDDPDRIIAVMSENLRHVM
ncbi:hypothetical protein IV203_015933 [Nitzschia inconspicua]|uniref:PDZ domain-containing protein n=1 Tax=Nitzschia inconspicua TaxID=303405 RepID=A0A9K3P903_9STRA|nr:hypothetical protein IV203_025040 [Nitzschia inconspicua]KAG7359344.1 hypothetical protein IV203_015933 [Nitzschia inconspicua]